VGVDGGSACPNRPAATRLSGSPYVHVTKFLCAGGIIRAGGCLCAVMGNSLPRPGRRAGHPPTFVRRAGQRPARRPLDVPAVRVGTSGARATPSSSRGRAWPSQGLTVLGIERMVSLRLLLGKEKRRPGSTAGPSAFSKARPRLTAAAAGYKADVAVHEGPGGFPGLHLAGPQARPSRESSGPGGTRRKASKTHWGALA
jgi:hypothetical protein